MFTDEAAILEGHAIGADELEVGNARRGFRGTGAGLCKAFTVEIGQAHKAVLTSCRDFLGRTVGAKKLSFVILVERDQRGDPARHPSVTGDGRMFRSREVETGFCLGDRHAQDDSAPGRGEIELRGHRFAFCGATLIP